MESEDRGQLGLPPSAGGADLAVKAESSDVPSVAMVGISKRFDDVIALAGVDVELHSGEVHALLGENGAGKSTLMNILSGVLRPEAGEIWLKGRPVHLRSPRHAAEHGIGIVHQLYRLVSNLTVAENLHLGWNATPHLIDRRDLNRRVEQMVERFGLAVRPEARIWELSVGEQQRVAILRTLTRGSEVIILDEPTAVLTPQEATGLFALLRHMTDEGKTIVF
ncbi:MAG TPA: ATP-binding cassette domain-containing protein, partial [Candidatus Dormibacteraeota bacterium]